MTQTCPQCQGQFTPRAHKPQRYCSRHCYDVARTVRAPDDRRVRRGARERDAPGLGSAARRRLMARWIRAGRACIYCDRPATTMDHVLPLVRGGTNHEANLGPACKPCNSSKSGLTVIEWRTGRRLPPMSDGPAWLYAVRLIAKPSDIDKSQLGNFAAIYAERRVYRLERLHARRAARDHAA